MPQNSSITVSFYETYGNRVVNTTNAISGNITMSVFLPVVSLNVNIPITVIQSNKLYGGLLFNSINDIKQNALILGSMQNRLVTNQDFVSYINYYLTNYFSYAYSTVSVIS
ncbi:MAG: hypothetical protein QXV17_01445 [Candidatus Micrarchaeaceae archaeon]